MWIVKRLKLLCMHLAECRDKRIGNYLQKKVKKEKKSKEEVYKTLKIK
jgi:hypothetical protein